jgi:hypothetical protein
LYFGVLLSAYSPMIEWLIVFLLHFKHSIGRRDAQPIDIFHNDTWLNGLNWDIQPIGHSLQSYARCQCYKKISFVADDEAK